ncbi:MAG: UDP-N-acetylmuramoyl-L-alanine--D-glutamate ligase [Sedimentisphaerales bacterium]|nr:UDP-N-acetylmuramoyl-L-alanine--D-glutamate ligase [Sedimentisphaerales bacterium]
MSINLLKDKSVVIMGLGVFGGGLDSAKFAARFAKKVVVTDTADEKKLAETINQLKQFDNIDFHLGGHQISDFTDSDVIIVNPAVDEANPYIDAAKSKGKLITSQMELFFQLCPAKIVAITGSNGKSTTTALTAHLLKNIKTGKVFLGGNIGNLPLLETLKQIKDNDIVVLEISSFQLEQLVRIKKSPHIACVTNIAPNHLDRHKTMENYCSAKENIFRFQKPGGIAVLNTCDEKCRQWYEKYKQTSRKCILFDREKLDSKLTEIFKLPGAANRENLAAAVTIAGCFGLKDIDLAESIGSFVSLPHRLELIREVDGVRYYNDSIATTPESTIVAVQAFDEPKILIAGGYDKGLNFDQMAEVICDKIKALILIGQTADKIERSARRTGKIAQIYRVKSLSEAVNQAGKISVSGDIVLLSPACASYDMFVNFADRGKQFGELVKQL